MAIAFGWQAAFIITGALGFLWIAGWFLVQRSRHVPQPAREAVSGATRAPAVAWGPLLRDRRVWAIGIAKMLSDAVWWFLLFWLPDFLHRVYNLDLKSFGLPLATIYTLATVGALFGGVLPAYLQKRGASVNAARKLSLLVSAIAVMPVPLVLGMTDYWNAVLLVGLALAAHQAFSTNVFALAVDMFGDGRVGTVVGIGALLGNIGGLAMLEFTAWTLDRTGSYLPMFLYAASAYVVALGLIQILAPRVDALGARA
jgi:ACS family hexuronate transporter-like MFS transporter